MAFPTKDTTEPANGNLQREYPELKSLRQQIDALDDEIIRLLIQRIGIVQQVGDLKYSQGETRCFIRPDREAIMLRDITARFRGSGFSEAAAAAIWRIIIGASTAAESPLNLSVADSREAGNAMAQAREYFGPTLPCRRHENAEDVLADIYADPHCLGVFPIEYQTSGDIPWWWQMANDTGHACRVFARLPFVLRGHPLSPPVFVASSVEPAPSGKDLTLFAIDADLTDVPLKGIHVLHSDARHDTCYTLFEANGWLTPDSPGFDALRQMLLTSVPGARFTLHFLGAYAQPFTVDS